MSAPAVPTADAGLLTSSTDGSPAVVSQEEVPQQNLLPSYAPRIGTLQQVDEYIRTHYIQIAKMNWNTTQLEGTVLYSNQIHPLRSNKIIRHLYKMFNTWTGGLDYKIKIAATGFNAGAIVVYRLPPNIDVSKVTTIENMTHFPHIIIEAKTLEMPCVEFIDQLRFFFHYTSEFDPKNPDTFGGHIVIAVWSPLVAVGSGPTSVNIILSNKASVNFNYAQIIPPDLMEQDGNIDVAGFNFLLNFDNPTNMFGQAYDKLRIMSTSTFPTLNKFTSNTVKLDGTLLSTINTHINKRLPVSMILADAGGFSDRIGLLKETQRMHWHYATLKMIRGQLDPATMIYLSDVVNANFEADTSNYVAFHQPADILIVDPNTTVVPTPVVTLTNPITLANAESFVSFFSYHIGVNTAAVQVMYDAQMYNTSKILFDEPLRAVDNTQALDYVVWDKVVNLPLFHVKLYHHGIMTGPATVNNIDYDMSDIRFEFVGIIPANSAIPTANYANMVAARQARDMFQRRARNRV